MAPIITRAERISGQDPRRQVSSTAMTSILPAAARLAAALTLSLAVAGCSLIGGAGPSEEEQRDADYGMEPLDPKPRVVALVRERYQDRNVVHVTVGDAQRGWAKRTGLRERKEFVYGWSVPFRGKRLGFVQMDTPVVQGYVFFRNDRILGIADENGFQFLD
jgi:hypothetical protein